MIKIEAFEGKFAPRCTCDVCGDVISRSDQGLVLYTTEPDGEIISDVDYKLVHKGECREKAIARWGGHGGDDEIFTVLIYALNNLGYRGEELKQIIDHIEGNSL